LINKSIIFADLDGTFLNDKYEYYEIKPLISQLRSFGSFIVFCSSKTRNEIEFYQKAAGIAEPFITENGAAIFIPKSYFSFNYACSKTKRYNVIRLGVPYGTLREKLGEIKKKTASKIVGFGDMTLEELAYDTGLPINLAKLAQKREHDEPFKIMEGNKRQISCAIRQHGLRFTEGGRYLHLTGENDKGKAVNILKSLYSQMFGNLRSFGVGNGPNDLPMLRVVDKPFLIRKNSDTNSRFSTWMGILQLISGKA